LAAILEKNDGFHTWENNLSWVNKFKNPALAAILGKKATDAVESGTMSLI
jgi:hypothetical protein